MCGHQATLCASKSLQILLSLSIESRLVSSSDASVIGADVSVVGSDAGVNGADVNVVGSDAGVNIVAIKLVLRPLKVFQKLTVTVYRIETCFKLRR